MTGLVAGVARGEWGVGSEFSYYALQAQQLGQVGQRGLE